MLRLSLIKNNQDYVINLPDTVRVIVNNRVQSIFSAVLRTESKENKFALAEALGKLFTEDSNFKITPGVAGNFLTIKVSGELQAEMIVDRLKSEFGITANVEKLNVIYLEPIVFIEIKIPKEFSTAVINELTLRGARVEQKTPLITAYARPKSILNFMNFLRSLTGFKDTHYSTKLAYYQEAVEEVDSHIPIQD